MRRLLLVLLALAGAAAALWYLAGGPWSGGPSDVARQRGAEGGAAEPLLRGRPGDGENVESKASPATPAPPPDWPHGSIRGRIVGLDGSPLTDASAAGLGVFDSFGNARRYCEASAVSDGTFLLYVQAGIPTIVVASAPGCGLVVGPRVHLGAGDARDLGTLVLSTEHRLPVRVVSDEGVPAEEVEVYLTSELDPRPEGWELALRESGVLEGRATGADGRVLFDRLPPGTWRVAIHTGATIAADQVREHVETDGEEIGFVLPARSAPQRLRVNLKIVGPDGARVPQATVTLEAADCSDSFRYPANPDESFEIECAGGAVRLVVLEAKDAAGRSLDLAPHVTPDVRGCDDPLIVHLERGSTITGRVSWDGDPATWVVKAWGFHDVDRGVCESSSESDAEPVYMSFEAQTDVDGAFLLAGMPRGRFVVSASGPGQLLGPAPVVEAGTTDLVLEMVPEGQVEVHVVAPKGRPFGTAFLELEEVVGDATVGAGMWWGGGGDRPDVKIYQATDLRPGGRYRLRAYGNCHGARCQGVLDGVSPRDEAYVLQLEELPHVQGVVEREDGTPVGGVQVRYIAWPGGKLASNPNILLGGPWLWFSLTDPTGAFDLSGFGNHDLVLGITGLGLTLRDAPPRVEPGTSGIRLVAVPERRISGRVVDPAGGSLEGLRAIAVPDRGAARLWIPQRVTSDGFFEVAGLTVGTYRVIIWNERDPKDLRYVLSKALPAGEREVRLELGLGAVLEGVIRDHRGRPIPRAGLRLEGRWTNRATSTDGEGRYAFHGIPRDVDLEVSVATATGRSIRRKVRLAGTADVLPQDLTVPKP